MSDIEEILKGIDQCETDSPDGWWETSAGAEFGARKLAEIREVMAARAQGGEAVAEIHKFGYGRRRTTVRNIEDLTKYPEGTKLCLCLTELK